MDSDQVSDAAQYAALGDRAEASVALGRWCEAELFETARSMTVAAGEQLLPGLGVSNPADLSPAQARRWRACAKSAVAAELNALAGWGIQNCHDRVGLSLAPRSIASHALRGLREGWNDSRAVLDFWRRVRSLSVESAEKVAQASLGPHVDGDGQPVRPSQAQFAERLGRAVISVEGSQATARDRRESRLRERDAFADIDDDGVGALSLTGGAASVAAAALRVDVIARKARSAGDPRAIGQIRSDLALALIIHGSILEAAGDSGRATAAAAEVEPGHLGIPDVGPLVRAALDRHPAPIKLEVVVPLNALVDGASSETGSITGVGAISAEHARELALTPGATMHRILTDPTDGRCIERSVATYLPDAEMLDQIRAADRTCRGPGCIRDAKLCQPDHERPYADGGETSETNLALKHSFHHNNKTMKLWESELHPDRRVTWSTLFGRSYVTRPHDYRSLMPLTCAAAVGSMGSSRQGQAKPSADSAVYLALAELWRSGSLTPMSDDGDSSEMAALLSLQHHTPGGMVRPGPSPVALAAIHGAEGVIDRDQSGFSAAKGRDGLLAGGRTVDEENDPPPF
ncbi:HNH endonuclease [Ornithinimicrobium sp. Arc0846-15]|nr:HNH endonuclease [Ornithinimicrobium laminariae]